MKRLTVTIGKAIAAFLLVPRFGEARYAVDFVAKSDLRFVLASRGAGL
jgi:hypothetical protein